MPFEKLDRTLVFLCGFLSIEGAEVSPLTGFRIFFAGVKPILARLKFSNHALAKRLVATCVGGLAQLSE